MPLSEDKVRIQIATLEIERAKVFIEFAKFGFRGTLAGGLLGMLLLLGLASLQACTDFKLETWDYVAIAFIIVIAVTAYGYFSLWSLPTIAAKIKDIAELKTKV